MEFVETPSFWCPHVGCAACTNFRTQTVELRPPENLEIFPFCFLLSHFPFFFLSLSTNSSPLRILFLLSFFLFFPFFASLFFSFSFLSSHFLSTKSFSFPFCFSFLLYEHFFLSPFLFSFLIFLLFFFLSLFLISFSHHFFFSPTPSSHFSFLLGFSPTFLRSH